MNNLKDIKKHFEHPSYDHRMDFIDEYDFNDSFSDYYKKFIIESMDIKNHLYLSELIDLARWLNIFNQELYIRYKNYLFQKRHYLVKLSVMDYLLDCPYFYKENDSEEYILKFKSFAKLLILRNQAYINLIALGTKNQDKYYHELKESLKKTNDWRSIYRTINMVISINPLEKYKNDLINFIKQLASVKDFGEGVKVKLSNLD